MNLPGLCTYATLSAEEAIRPLAEAVSRDSVITFPLFGNLTLNPPAAFTVFGRTIYLYGVITGQNTSASGRKIFTMSSSGFCRLPLSVHGSIMSFSGWIIIGRTPVKSSPYGRAGWPSTAAFSQAQRQCSSSADEKRSLPLRCWICSPRPVCSVRRSGDGETSSTGKPLEEKRTFSAEWG